MVFLFKGKSIGTIFFLVALCCAVHAHLFIHHSVTIQSEDSGVISYSLQHFFPQIYYPAIAPFAYLAIILIQAIRLNVLLNDLRMYNSSGFTAALSYILLTAIVPQWSSLTPAIIANSFVIWIFIYLSKLYNAQNPKSTLYNTGLLVGCSFLCYHPTIILIAVVLFALAVVRPFILSEWFVLLMGILTPVYLYVSFLFLDNRMYVFYATLPHFELNMPIRNTDIWLWIKMGAILSMLVLGIQYWSLQNNRMVIQIRKNWSAMFVMVVIMLPIPFVFKNGGLESATLCIIPLAAFIGNTYLYPKKWLLPNLLFLFSIVLIVHSNWTLSK